MKMKWFELIRGRMKPMKVTREKIGESLGRTPGAIGHWLNGRREPSLAEIAAMLKCVSVDSVRLYSDGTVSEDDVVSTVKSDSKAPNLREDQMELLRLFDSLPKDEADRFLKEIKAKSAHFNAIFEEMLKKRQLGA